MGMNLVKILKEAKTFFNPTDMSLSKLQETVKDKEAWRAAVHLWGPLWGRKESDMMERLNN